MRERVGVVIAMVSAALLSMTIVAAQAPPAQAGVGCVTSHRGVPVPKQLADILIVTANEKGTPAAVDQYRDLRKQFYGGQSYDFSENGLIAVAQRLATDKPDEALKWLELNTEVNPKSSWTYLLMAQIYGRKNDKENQIKHLEKAVELDPQNQQAARMLEQIRK